MEVEDSVVALLVYRKGLSGLGLSLQVRLKRFSLFCAGFIEFIRGFNKY